MFGRSSGPPPRDGAFFFNKSLNAVMETYPHNLPQYGITIWLVLTMTLGNSECMKLCNINKNSVYCIHRIVICVTYNNALAACFT